MDAGDDEGLRPLLDPDKLPTTACMLHRRHELSAASLCPLSVATMEPVQHAYVCAESMIGMTRLACSVNPAQRMMKPLGGSRVQGRTPYKRLVRFRAKTPPQRLRVSRPPSTMPRMAGHLLTDVVASRRQDGEVLSCSVLVRQCGFSSMCLDLDATCR